MRTVELVCGNSYPISEHRGVAFFGESSDGWDGRRDRKALESTVSVVLSNQRNILPERENECTMHVLHTTADVVVADAKCFSVERVPDTEFVQVKFEAGGTEESAIVTTFMAALSNPYRVGDVYTVIFTMKRGQSARFQNASMRSE